MSTDPPAAKPRSRFADRPTANRVFTNRDRPIAYFDAARANLPADEHRILGFHGVGGQGKTASVIVENVLGASRGQSSNHER